MAVDSAVPRVPRRALLLSGALLGPLALAGCSSLTERLPWVKTPRATVTMDPLPVAESVLPEHPVLSNTWAVSPTADRPSAMMIRRDREFQTTLHAVTLEAPDGLEVPVARSARDITVDGHGDLVRVLTGVIVDGGIDYTMHTSADLVEWTERPLSTQIGELIQRAREGIVLGQVEGSTARVLQVDDDGTVTSLESLALEELSSWSVKDIARSQQTIVVLLEISGEDGDYPATVTSQDGGQSWAAVQELPVTGAETVAEAVRSVGEGFVVTGWHDVEVDGSDGETVTRLTAWSAAGGTEFTQEDLPVPRQGEGWFDDDGNALDPDAPLARMNFIGSAPVRGIDDGRLHMPCSYYDVCRVFSRAGDGTWSVSDEDGLAGAPVEEAVADPRGRLIRLPNQVNAQGAGAKDPEGGVTYSSQREFQAATGMFGEGTVGALTWSIDTTHRDGRGTWIEGTAYRGISVRLLDGELVEGEKLPRDAAMATGLAVHLLGDGPPLLTGRKTPPDSDIYTARAWVLSDGEWTEVEGLDVDAAGAFGFATTIDGTHYLPLAQGTKEGGGDEWTYTPSVFSSQDGARWEETPWAADLESPAGGYIYTLRKIDDVVYAGGGVLDADGGARGALFVLDGENWSAHPVGESQSDAPATRMSAVNGKATAAVDQDGLDVHFTISADGAVSELLRSTEEEEHYRLIDLGEGALISGGWIDREAAEVEEETEIGKSSCLWASLDSGETWNATPVPGRGWRFPGLQLLRDGDDVIVLVDDFDAPRALRIIAARQDVLDEES